MAAAAVVIILRVAGVAVEGIDMHTVVHIGIIEIAVAVCAGGEQTHLISGVVFFTIAVYFVAAVAAHTGESLFGKMNIRNGAGTNAEESMTAAAGVTSYAVINHIRSFLKIVAVKQSAAACFWSVDMAVSAAAMTFCTVSIITAF